MKKQGYHQGATLLVLLGLNVAFVADDDFMAKASQANVAEVAAAKLAVMKSSSAKVKGFARQMIADHSAAEKELVQLAKKKGASVPMEPDGDHKALADSLKNLAGPAFDSVYLRAQLADHHTAVALFTEESSNGTDPDTKVYAAKYLPKLKGHLSMIPGHMSGMGSGSMPDMPQDSAQ